MSVRYANVVLVDERTSIARLIAETAPAALRKSVADPQQAHRSVSEIAYAPPQGFRLPGRLRRARIHALPSVTTTIVRAVGGQLAGNQHGIRPGLFDEKVAPASSLNVLTPLVTSRKHRTMYTSAFAHRPRSGFGRQFRQDGEPDGPGELTHAQPIHHAGAVHLDGAHADVEIVGDNLIGVPGHQRFENVPFSRA